MSAKRSRPAWGIGPATASALPSETDSGIVAEPAGQVGLFEVERGRYGSARVIMPDPRINETGMISDAGPYQAERAADDWWFSAAMRALRAEAASGRVFSAWDLSEPPYAIPDPDCPARWGALFRAAARWHLIVPAGFEQSRRPGRAGGLCRTWRGAPR